jgi:hypothetical protein
MTLLVRSSSWIYSGILLIYPYELRDKFGVEMAAVFADDLADACRTRRFAPVARVWWHALAELPAIAIPGRFANPLGNGSALVAPAISVAIHLALLGGFLALATVASDGIPPAIVHGFLTLRGQ